MAVRKWMAALAAVVAASAMGGNLLEACTRVVYRGPGSLVVAARSMDWEENPSSNLYCFPRGMERNGAAGPNSITWTSKYGSVICAFYGVASVDGINEKGLVANTLYLVESDYGKPTPTDRTLSIAAWAQYALDNFATVDEAVQALEKNPFVIIAPVLPNGVPAQGHLSLSDVTGDSAILEYVDGKLVIHHGAEYQVMTNSPIFSKQLALNEYWEQIGGMEFLPGTIRASDRFARASFFIHALPEMNDSQQAVAAVASVIRGVSVPLGIKAPNEPNVASTIWRTVYDQKNLVAYFDSASSPLVFWTELSDLDFSAGAPVKKLELSGGQVYSGNVADKYEPAQPFPFLPGKP